MDPERRGMIPRAVRRVFQGAQELAQKGWQVRMNGRGRGYGGRGRGYGGGGGVTGGGGVMWGWGY